MQDVNVLMDIVESVSPTIPDNWDDYQEESEVKILWKIHCWKYFSPSANFQMISCKIFHPIGSHDSIMELTVH